MRIMKLGGTSLVNAAAIGRVLELAGSSFRKERTAIVVSALAGVTDHLLEAADHAVDAYERTGEIFTRCIRDRHLAVIEEMMPPARRSRLMAEAQVLLNELDDVLHGVHLVRECSAGTRDLVLSYGERLSATILTHLLQEQGLPGRYVDSRPLVLTHGLAGAAVVDLETTIQRIRQQLLPCDELYVITGFLAGNADGLTTTLGCNGSDYTATIFGAALDADEVEIRTDVDGLYTADPRLVPEATVIERMTYEEAQEMAYLGASVIFPQALQPAADRQMPVVICSALGTASQGTRITGGDGEPSGSPPVRGLTTLGGIALVNVEGSGMIGRPGIAGRLFNGLAEHGINTVMISQASSEHSICFVTGSHELERAVRAVQSTFASELSNGLIQRIEQLDRLAVVSVIGSRMRGTVGLSGKLFSALGTAGVNVLAIAQGCSEQNISIVVAETDARAAMQAIHGAFGLDQAQVPVGAAS